MVGTILKKLRHSLEQSTSNPYNSKATQPNNAFKLGDHKITSDADPMLREDMIRLVKILGDSPQSLTSYHRRILSGSVSTIEKIGPPGSPGLEKE